MMRQCVQQVSVWHAVDFRLHMYLLYHLRSVEWCITLNSVVSTVKVGLSLKLIWSI